MTNKDKYLKDGVDVEKFITELELKITEKQGRAYTDYELDVALHEFFEQQVKPTLTEDEKVILRNIKGLKEIYRSTNEDGDLGVTCEICNGYIAKYWINAFNHLFQFIKPRRRI